MKVLRMNTSRARKSNKTIQKDDMRGHGINTCGRRIRTREVRVRKKEKKLENLTLETP
jgi:hypothetical protein